LFSLPIFRKNDIWFDYCFQFELRRFSLLRIAIGEEHDGCGCIVKHTGDPFCRPVKRDRRGERGFTFVELVLTITIFGILVAVAIVKYVDLTARSKTAVCMANQFALESAQTLYYTNQIMNNDPSPHYAASLDQLIPFMRDNVIPTCPLGFSYQIIEDGKIRCEDDDHLRRFLTR
jgi:prepilin-type N-terminal cleavage/methylation domain-containing protein